MLDKEAFVPIQREMKDVLGQFLYAVFPAFKHDQKAAHLKGTCAGFSLKRHTSAATCQLL